MYYLVHIPTGLTFETHYNNISDFMNWFNMLFDENDILYNRSRFVYCKHSIVTRYLKSIASDILDSFIVHDKIEIRDWPFLNYYKSEFTFYYRKDKQCPEKSQWILMEP